MFLKRTENGADARKKEKFLMLDISGEVRERGERAEARLRDVFRAFDRTAEIRTEQILEAFARHRVSEAMFAGSTGYGYDDLGRNALEAIYADVFGTEAGLVRIGFANGTHAIACGLYAACEPGRTLVSAVGAPYDTMRGVIGIDSPGHGTLASYGVKYREVPVTEDGLPDRDGILDAVRAPDTGAVLIQRSRGYSGRKSLSAAEITALYRAIKELRPDINVVVDNCYGEFADESEPEGDLLCGSLIKNPGGGLAPCGGYVVGRRDFVARAAERLTVPGIGGEVGATLGQNRLLFQGLFLAPSVVASALKTAAFAAALLEEEGVRVSPGPFEERHDIIESLDLGSAKRLRAFCEGIQSGAPVDSFVTPEPWPMPGYDCDVIMAAGAFIGGSSIELSCDGPVRPPYRAFLQGGLTWPAGKLGVLLALERFLKA